MHPNEISGAIIACAMRVHTSLGPGLLEKCYKVCLAYELREAGFQVKTQVPLPVIYREVRMNAGYRMDLVVNETVVVEIKATEGTTPLHCAQLMSYLRLSGKKLGLLINFNVVHLRDGIRRIVNHLDPSASSASPAFKSFERSQ